MRTRFVPFAVLLAAVNSSGCMTIEKKSMVVVVPPASKQVHMYYVFEGISVTDGEKLRYVENAKKELDDLKKPDFSFFIPGLGSDKKLAQYCRFEDVRFFVRPDRARKVCMDRRVTITDRDAFARELNERITVELRKLKQADTKELLAGIKKVNEPAELEKMRQLIDRFGMGPFMKTLIGLFSLANEYDLDSLEKFKTAAFEGERWLRFDADTISLHLPATPACAKRIVTSKGAKDWLKEMSDFVTPIDLTTDKIGLIIVLGKKDEPIRFKHEDRRPHRQADEKVLFEHAGLPKAIMIDGKAANAELLIERFLAEKKK